MTPDTEQATPEKLVLGVAEILDPAVWGKVAHRVPVAKVNIEQRRRHSLKKAAAVLAFLEGAKP